MTDALRDHGADEKKSSMFSPKTELIPAHLEHHFWRGMVDGDGSIFTSRGKPVVSLCGTYDVCSKFIKFVNDNVRLTSKTPNRDHNIWSTSFSGRFGREVIRKLYEGNKM